MRYTPKTDLLLHPWEHAEVTLEGPVPPVKSMKQVEVNAVGSEALKLFVKNTVKVRACFNITYREFSGKLDLIAIAILECLAYGDLTVARVVEVSGIYIVDAVIDGIPYHSHRFRNVYIRLIAIQNREPHSAKAESRWPKIDIRETSILHSPGSFEVSGLQRHIHLCLEEW